MKTFLRATWLVGVCILFIEAGTGCSSGYYSVAKHPPENFQSLGVTTGEACGTIIIGPTAYNAIPIQLNSRTERAYQDALVKVPGATSLMNVQLEENWIWWIIGTTRCVKITGEAIK